MRSIACAVFLTTTLLWSRPADADLITIEPDAFAAGTNLTAATPGVASLDRPPTMKYVFAGSTEGGIALDRLSFEQVQVPEPSTLLLTMAGLVGLRGYRRQRTRSKSRIS